MTEAADRVKASGVAAASMVDLLAIAFARRESDASTEVKEVREVLRKYGSARSFGEISFSDLKEAGFDDYEALRFLSILEIGRRVGGAGKGEAKGIEEADDIYDLLKGYANSKKEHFLVVLLDAKNCVQRVAEVHIGTLTMSVVGPREVFREAIRDGACSIILAHNHPSGDPTPSPEDIAITKKLKELGDSLDIPVLDHIIIGERRYTSLKAQGLF